MFFLIEEFAVENRDLEDRDLQATDQHLDRCGQGFVIEEKVEQHGYDVDGLTVVLLHLVLVAFTKICQLLLSAYAQVLRIGCDRRLGRKAGKLQIAECGDESPGDTTRRDTTDTTTLAACSAGNATRSTSWSAGNTARATTWSAGNSADTATSSGRATAATRVECHAGTGFAGACAGHGL